MEDGWPLAFHIHNARTSPRQHAEEHHGPPHADDPPLPRGCQGVDRRRRGALPVLHRLPELGGHGPVGLRQGHAGDAELPEPLGGAEGGRTPADLGCFAMIFDDS